MFKIVRIIRIPVLPICPIFRLSATLYALALTGFDFSVSGGFRIDCGMRIRIIRSSYPSVFRISSSILF